MGRPISWFDALSASDRNFIVAYWTVKDRMVGWEQQKQAEALENAGRK
jgi:hypothetical protein